MAPRHAAPGGARPAAPQRRIAGHGQSATRSRRRNAAKTRCTTLNLRSAPVETARGSRHFRRSMPLTGIGRLLCCCVSLLRPEWKQKSLREGRGSLFQFRRASTQFAPNSSFLACKYSGILLPDPPLFHLSASLQTSSLSTTRYSMSDSLIPHQIHRSLRANVLSFFPILNCSTFPRLFQTSIVPHVSSRCVLPRLIIQS